MQPHHILLLTTVLGAFGLWLMLPRGTTGGRRLGIILATIALGLGVAQMPRLGPWMADGLFWVLAGVAVVSAAAAVTFRNPVYCAIWFGFSLLGVAGVLLFLGAQFIAAATVLVYAGAILVMFLFVLMLAETHGAASYDRTSWEALLSAATGMVLVGVLSMTVSSVFSADAYAGNKSISRWANNSPKSEPIPSPPPNITAPRHVARLGAELFGPHLPAVVLAGVLLLTALVATAVIVAEEKNRR